MDYTDAQIRCMILVFRREFHRHRVCFYCGCKMRKAKPMEVRKRNYYLPHDTQTVEHVRPICRGGDNIPENCVLACQRCNNAKGHRTLEEFRFLRYFSYEVEFFFETELRRMLEKGLLIPAELGIEPAPLPPPIEYDRMAD